MWVPLVMVCQAMCFVVGGPVIKSERECKTFVGEVMVPYVMRQSPGSVITDLRCIQWEQEG